MADMNALFGGDDSDSDGSTSGSRPASPSAPSAPPAPTVEYGAPLSLVNQPLLFDGSSLSSSYSQLAPASDLRKTKGPCKKGYGGTRAPVTNAKSSLHFTKLPNFVGIETQPFDKDLFDEDEQEQKFKMTHSIVRWRYKVDPVTNQPIKDPNTGHSIRESNARVIKWSDGTFSLAVGKDIFTLASQDTPIPSYIASTQKSNGPTPASRKTVLELEGPVRSKLVVENDDSRITQGLMVSARNLAVKKKEVIVQAAREHAMDPVKEMEARARMKDELLRQQERKSGKNAYGRRDTKRPIMGREYLDGSDEEGDQGDTVNLRDLKRQGGEDDDYGDDDDDDDDDDQWMKGKRATRAAPEAKKRKERDDSEEEEADFGDDDDEEEEADFGDDDDDGEEEEEVVKKAPAPRKKVIDDDDE